MKRWEYRQYYLHQDEPLTLIDLANKLGQEGWELVECRSGGQLGTLAIFKRPLAKSKQTKGEVTETRPTVKVKPGPPGGYDPRYFLNVEKRSTEAPNAENAMSYATSHPPSAMREPWSQDKG